MLITLIFVGILILGIVGVLCFDSIMSEGLEIAVITLLIVGIIGVLVCGTLIIGNHVNVSVKQAKIDMEYNTLLNEVDCVKDLQNEPVSDLTRIEYTNIAERVLYWNQRALEAQMLGNNPWTSWFYNDAERSMKLIEY